MGRAFGGAAQGAALGSAIAPGIGTAIGAGVGFLGGLFGGGGGKARKQAQEDINAFASSLRRSSLLPLAAAFADLDAQLHDLAKQAAKTGANIQVAVAAVRAEKTRLQMEFDQAQAQIRGGLEAERLRLGGDDAAAATLELQLRNQKEAQEALAQGFSATTREALAQVQALREVALARDLEAQAIEKAAAGLIAESSLAAREASLRGDSLSQARLEADALREQQRAEAEVLRLRGDITEEFFQRLVNVIDGEAKRSVDDFTASLRDQAQAQRDAAQAQRDAETEASGSLAVRALRATGRGSEADLLEQQQRREREIADALGRGFSEAFIEELRRVQGLEQRPVVDMGLAMRGSVQESRTTSVTAITSAQGDTIGSLIFSQVVLLRDLRDDVRVIRTVASRTGGTDSVRLLEGLARTVDAGAGARLSVTNSAAGVRPLA